MGRYLLVDGGQGGCRVVDVVDGQRVGNVTGAGLRRRERNRAAGLLSALERALRDMRPRPLDVDGVVAGLTGFDDSQQTAREIADGIRSLVRAERVVVTNDAVTSYLGAIGFEPGAIVAAGTGAIALAGDKDGNLARGDGWGYILGDDGGGYYVGRRGLAGALRAHDGRGGSQALKKKAIETFGAAESIKDRVYGADNPVSEVASFAPAVAEAAREGDPMAVEIWDDAARELSTTVAAVLGQVFVPGTPVIVSQAGRLFDARDLLLEPFERHVAQMWPAGRLLGPKGTAITGAELLARTNPPPMFGSLIHAS